MIQVTSVGGLHFEVATSYKQAIWQLLCGTEASSKDSRLDYFLAIPLFPYVMMGDFLKDFASLSELHHVLLPGPSLS